MLGLAVTTHLYPRLESYGAGRLTKIRAQAVSGRSCRAVAERLGLPERLRSAAPDAVAGPATDALAQTERVGRWNRRTDGKGINGESWEEAPQGRGERVFRWRPFVSETVATVGVRRQPTAGS